MTNTSPIILWFRRDLRLGDHTAVTAAIETGRPVIPLFIADEATDDLGAAPKWRLGLAVDHFRATLQALGSDLILRHGPAQQVLNDVIRETSAGAVYWSRLYWPAINERDAGIKSDLEAQGIEARSFAGHLLFEPWRVQTKTGGYYKVYTPFWNSVRHIGASPCLPAPEHVPAPSTWPQSDQISDWDWGKAMQRGADVVAKYQSVGEDRALKKLADFCDGPIERYKNERDRPDIDGTSRLSENLTYGEISPRQCWHTGCVAMERGAAGAEHFLKELVWREFAYHLFHHAPDMDRVCWRKEWEGFPWKTNKDAPEVSAWSYGLTGQRFVDAAMRELFVTGIMHNRARMIVASYLTKHLMVDWRIGMNWFADCLTDWDPASNAMGWQWVAGCGPDAAPYFRVFNPETQAQKFDLLGIYQHRWIAEIQPDPPQTALDFFHAVPMTLNLSADVAYPNPIVELADGRNRALSAYQKFK